MIRKTFVVMAIIATAACSQLENNPFYGEYKTQYGVPPFDKIKLAHYLPAFTKGIEQQAAEVISIANNTDAPTFANTIEALDRSGELLERVSRVFFPLYSAETSPEMDKLASTISPMLSKNQDDILLNEKLFERIKTVYEQKDSLSLSLEQKKLLENFYKNFVRGGANLDAAQKEKMRGVNEKLSSLTLKFGQNLLAETNSFSLRIENKEDLAGLPNSLLEASEKDGAWEFTLKNPSLMPFLQYSSNADLREKMLSAYANRGNNGNEFDNKAVIAEILDLRIQKAQLLGYTTYADYVLDDCMAKSPTKVYDMLKKLWTPALKKANAELADQQKLMLKNNEGTSVKASDWRYYEQKIKQANYNLDEEELRPYFPLANVRNGIFTITQKLFGLQFTDITAKVPVYHKDVTCYEVHDANSDFLGLIYMDFFPRAGKRGGAWMTSFRKQKYDNGERVAPVISIVCNFSTPTADAPSLLTPDEVETFFHEFGHALHGLLSNCKYQSLSGTSVARDFVELPSQIMENWAFEPECLALYAKHYQTNEVIPQALVEKMNKANKYGQGFKTVEYIAASWLDMDYHTLKSSKGIDVQNFEKQQMANINLIAQILPRYRSTYFNHIFAGGYSAGYYSYIWAEVLDADAFEQFTKSGDLFNPKIATAFRKSILERGGTEEPMELYKQFRNGEPNITALVKRRGLN
ncbi:MAG: M3 family metallopeptidase [Bacteroidales bacterium]